MFDMLEYISVHKRHTLMTVVTMTLGTVAAIGVYHAVIRKKVEATKTKSKDIIDLASVNDNKTSVNSSKYNADVNTCNEDDDHNAYISSINSTTTAGSLETPDVQTSSKEESAHEVECDGTQHVDTGTNIAR